MKKLKLNLDDLKVESFMISGKTSYPKGTIKGQDDPTAVTACGSCPDPTCQPESCPELTCAATCPNTCEYSCGAVTRFEPCCIDPTSVC